METLKEDIDQVKTSIIEHFSEPFQENALRDFIINGSKYIRSKIALLYLKANSIKLTTQIYKILAAGEIIHNASLLHDDVIDNASTRRGISTIGKTYSEKISILAGDYLLSFAMEKILELDNTEIITLFKNCTKEMAKAEIEQFLHRGSIPTEATYIDFCNGKTAKLFSTILESCAEISNLDTVIARDFGKYYGICFQIKNDLEPTSTISDKMNNIYTAKDILGIEKTQLLLDNYKEKLLEIISNCPNNTHKKHLEKAIREL